MQPELDFSQSRFNGADYNHERDHARLGAQLQKIFDLMKDGQWRELNQIARITGAPEASISAELRHLRKPRFGSHTIEKEYIENGLYKYRLILNSEKNKDDDTISEGFGR